MPVESFQRQLTVSDVQSRLLQCLDVYKRQPGLCIRTVCRGSYHQIPSVYARHQEWMETEGYTYRLPPYDVYITHPDEVADMEENITEIYSPIMKR